MSCRRLTVLPSGTRPDRGSASTIRTIVTAALQKTATRPALVSVRRHRHGLPAASKSGNRQRESRSTASVNGHREIRLDGLVISRLAATRFPGWWPPVLPAGGLGCQRDHPLAREGL